MGGSRMVLRACLVLLAAVGAGPAALAAGWPVVAGWETVQGPNFCMTTRRYAGDPSGEVSIGMFRTGRGLVVATGSDWTVEDGVPMPDVAVRAGGGAPNGRGLAVGRLMDGRRGIMIPVDARFFEDAARGGALEFLVTWRVVHTSPLSGAAEAIAQLRRCVAGLGAPASGPTPPAAPAPAPSQSRAWPSVGGWDVERSVDNCMIAKTFGRGVESFLLVGLYPDGRVNVMVLGLGWTAEPGRPYPGVVLRMGRAEFRGDGARGTEAAGRRGFILSTGDGFVAKAAASPELEVVQDGSVLYRYPLAGFAKAAATARRCAAGIAGGSPPP